MLDLDDIHRIYTRIKKDIAKAYQKGDINKTIRLIDTYASVAQRINDIYRDDEIEKYIIKIAHTHIGVIDNPRIKNKNSKKIVFYDQIGTTICLGVQYIQGLLENGYEILYIYESPYGAIRNNLLKLLQKEKNIEILLWDSTGNHIEKARELRDKIASYGSNKLIIHSPAFGAFGAIVLSTLPFITRYRIVPGDHHFYIGYDCTDFYLEFRNFGIQVALKKRKLSPDVLYKLPYYPLILEGIHFQGFPQEAKGKTVIVAAGAEYKFHGSDLFFEMCTRLLNEHPDVVILFIGDASEKINNYIRIKGLEGHFIPLGYRTDFSECIKHADILFNSYPFPGGLICQYAAYYSLPILSYSEKEHSLNRSVRGLLGTEDTISPISYSDKKEFYAYADKILKDKNYRYEEGKRMKSLLQTRECFTDLLGKILSHEHIPPSEILSQESDFEYRINYYLDLQNHFRIDIINPLLAVYGIRFLVIFSFLYPSLIQQKRYVIQRILNTYAKKASPYFHNKLKHVLKK